MTENNTNQKTPFFRFFEIWFQNFWMLVPISFVYSVISALLIPHGLAQAGMTNVARNLARDRHSFGISDFFDTIKANWKQALIVSIINLLVTIALGFGVLFYYNSEGLFADIALGFLLLCFVIFSFMRYYICILCFLRAARLPQGARRYSLSYLHSCAFLHDGIRSCILYA